MRISNQPFQRKFLTGRGVVDSSEVHVGDYLYEWRTGNHLEVKDVQPVTYNNMYEIVYSDGRIEYHTDHEDLYLDEYTVAPHSPFCKCRKTSEFPIQLYPLDFTRYTLVNNLWPDPYIAGVLLMHGDQDDQYINYPIDRTEANNEFSHKYNVDYCFNLEELPYSLDDKAYFQWKGKADNTPLTWEQFFPSYKFYAKDHCLSNYFPTEYLYSSINDRTQFIRGVFDMGYIQRRSPDSVSLFHKNREKLVQFQPFLWSMGLMNQICYDDTGKDGLVWRMDIIGIFSRYPGFFYHREYIEGMIDANNLRQFPNPDNTSVTVVDVKPLEDCPIYTHNPQWHVYLKESHMIYTSANFLPRVSI